jgi:glycerol-3-phosphate dehydrogenase
MSERQTDAASRRDHDLIVIGGGIQGACVALEAVRRGLRPLLIERDRFGGATSASSLRILHGGLRYLQSADLSRVLTSVRERRWFCRTFPELVRPLQCVMPLYGDGPRRPALMRPVLALNDLLSLRRNAGVADAVRLPRGRVLSAAETAALFPTVRRNGLRGGALWYDAVMTDPDAIMTTILRWVESLGGMTLDHVEAVGAAAAGGRITGVEALDRISGAALTFRAPVVINCAGPWAAEVAAALCQPAAGLATRALAFNLLLDREPLSEASVAVPSSSRGRMLFLVPSDRRIMVGTYHAPWSSLQQTPAATEAQIATMLDDLNRAVPGFDAARDDVADVLAGFMPADGSGDGTPASRPVLLDHASHGGLQGMHSVVAVKYTTARDVAERALKRAFGRRPLRPDAERIAAAAPPSPTRSADTGSAAASASDADG